MYICIAINYTWGTAMNKIVFPVRVKNYTAAIFLLTFIRILYVYTKCRITGRDGLRRDRAQLFSGPDCRID
jgi:hypothetical protein